MRLPGAPQIASALPPGSDRLAGHAGKSRCSSSGILTYRAWCSSIAASSAALAATGKPRKKRSPGCPRCGGRRYDLVVDLGGQLRTALFCLATGAPVRLGLEQAREGAGIVYTHRAPVPTYDIHAVDRYLSVAGVLGLDDRPPDFRIYLADEVDQSVTRLLAEHGLANQPFALIAPGTIWETKHWTEAGFAAVGRQLRERGLAVVLAGSPNDRARTQTVAAQCSGAIDLAGRTSVAELVALIGRAKLCVTNDSGAMHLAVAQQRPLVSLFGPTSPLRNGPYLQPEAVIRLDLPCSPCFIRKLSGCHYQHRCMHELSPAMVIERIDEVLRDR